MLRPVSYLRHNGDANLLLMMIGIMGQVKHPLAAALLLAAIFNIRLIQKWLKAGILENGVVTVT